MKVIHSILLALIFIIFQINEVISENDPCTLVNDGTFIGDPDLCNGWIRCSNGTSHKGFCPDQMRFNVAKEACDLAENVPCKDDGCKDKDGEFLPDNREPKICSAYFYCHEGVAESYNCPDGLHYYAEKSICDYKSTCVDETRNVCAYIPDGKKLLNPTDCSAYYECTGQKSVDKKCEDGKLFDQKTGNCNDADKVDCEVQCGENDESILNPKSCLSYYTCTSKKREEIKCNKDTEFVLRTETTKDGKTTIEIKCANKMLVDDKACPNRCEGKTTGFMPKYETEDAKKCQAYYTCSNGKIANKDKPQKCPDKYLLDLKDGLCRLTANIDTATCTKKVTT